MNSSKKTWDMQQRDSERSIQAGEIHAGGDVTINTGIIYQILQSNKMSDSYRHSAEVFDVLISDKTSEFIGREYVFDAINDFLDDAGITSGYFIIQAHPGAGKSSILAKFAQKTNCLVHFNIRSQSISSPKQFLEGILNQLVVEYKLKERQLPIDDNQYGSFLLGLLEEASRKLSNEKKLIIAVDALDEVNMAEEAIRRNINTLYLPSNLPDNVYFVMTSRPGWRLSVVEPIGVIDLDDPIYEKEVQKDIVNYIEYKVNESPRLQEWIKSQNRDLDEFIEILSDRSEKNFMYLYYVIPEIHEGIFQNKTVETLPRGLEEYYKTHWSIMMKKTDDDLRSTKIWAAYVLSEARQPVTLGQIAMFARISEDDELKTADKTNSVLDEWRQFMLEQVAIDGTNLYSLYHQSFKDFLNRKDIIAQAHGIASIKSPQNVSYLMAMSFYEHYGISDEDDD